MIPSQLSNLTSRSLQAFEPNALPHISSTLDPHLEIQCQFLLLPLLLLLLLLFTPSVYSALSYFLELTPSLHLPPSGLKHVKLPSLHLLTVPFIISSHFINLRTVWSAC